MARQMTERQYKEAQEIKKLLQKLDTIVKSKQPWKSLYHIFNQRWEKGLKPMEERMNSLIKDVCESEIKVLEDKFREL